MTGLIYDVNKNYSIYASYSSVYIPQAGDYTFSGQLIAPVEGSQYEVGIKGEYLDGKLNTSVALFRAREQNRAIGDIEHIGFYLSQGKVQSQGVDAHISGKITPDWTIDASYTYTDWQKFDTSFTTSQTFLVITPKHLFKLWTDYRLPGQWNDWSIGGDVYAQTKVFYHDANGFLSDFTLPEGTLVAPGYATFGAHVGYKVNQHVNASLSISNIIDRKYISSLTTGGLGTYYGTPRTALFTLRGSI